MSARRLETAAGTVEGNTVPAPDGTTLQRFLGIPYAGSPAGEGRWRRPIPAPSWAGVRAARAFGPSAPQGAPLPSALPTFTAAATEEACLSLNVWTPASTGRRPVLVWIHGGAFTSGGSCQPVYDGARLAAELDAVVVTVNYRLGALGFLCPDGVGAGSDTVGNAGLHDQAAALDWVREHASVLGGDPGRLTVFGESAGAGSILHLLGARRDPVATRAIAQSGEARTLSREEAAHAADALAAALDLPDATADRLRRVPVPALLAAQEQVTIDLFGRTGIMPLAPAVDDDLIDCPIQDAFRAGRGASVPLVLGTTRDELRLFPDPSAADLDDERLARRVGRLVPGTDPPATVAAYRAALGPAAANADVWEAVRTDARMRIPTLGLADTRADAGAATFVYRFDWEAPGLGAVHAVDLPFTFGTFDAEGWDDAVGYDADAERLGRELRAAWGALAATGDPSSSTRSWPAYELAQREVMVFGRASRVVEDPDAAVRACYP